MGGGRKTTPHNNSKSNALPPKKKYFGYQIIHIFYSFSSPFSLEKCSSDAHPHILLSEN